MTRKKATPEKVLNERIKQVADRLLRRGRPARSFYSLVAGELGITPERVRQAMEEI